MGPSEDYVGVYVCMHVCMYVLVEAQRGPAWIEQTCRALGWLAGWLAGWLRPRDPRSTLGLQLPGMYVLSGFGPINRKLSGHRRCTEKCCNEMNWKQTHFCMYVLDSLVSCHGEQGIWSNAHVLLADTMALMRHLLKAK